MLLTRVPLPTPTAPPAVRRGAADAESSTGAGAGDDATAVNLPTSTSTPLLGEGSSNYSAVR